MFLFLSKLLPLLIYPLGLTFIFMGLALTFRKKKRWHIVFLVTSLTILWLGSNRWVAEGLTRSLEWQYSPLLELPKEEVIVVLGGGTEPIEYPRQMVEIGGAGDRVIYAGWLYQQGVAPKLLLSGGRIDWMNHGASTPAAEMKELLLLMGVPEEAFWLEDTSLNTYENTVNCKLILMSKGIDSVVLVTSALHMPRSVALFEHQGIEVIPAPTDYIVTQASWDELTNFRFPAILFKLLPNSGNMQLTTRAMKEYIGIIMYKMRGWL